MLFIFPPGCLESESSCPRGRRAKRKKASGKRSSWSYKVGIFPFPLSLPFERYPLTTQKLYTGISASAMAIGSDVLVARTGRLRQRYENQYRLVAGCVPYKVTCRDGEQDMELHVLMISSPNRDDLVFPKGGWENDETDVEAACREALEEAGVAGTIRGSLGEWVFRSKSSEKSNSPGGYCRGSMFALEVEEEMPSWAEQACHQRKWLPADKAWVLCRYPWMREALKRCEELVLGRSDLPSAAAAATTTAPPPSLTPDALVPYYAHHADKDHHHMESPRSVLDGIMG